MKQKSRKFLSDTPTSGFNVGLPRTTRNKDPPKKLWTENNIKLYIVGKLSRYQTESFKRIKVKNKLLR